VSSDFVRLAQEQVQAAILVKHYITEDVNFLQAMEQVAWEVIRSLRAGGKVLLFGNGGSAADAQHIAAELVGRYKLERPGLPAIAVTVNTSTLTAIANDYGYEHVFARQVQTLGRSGDVAVGISTSGNAPNVLRGLETAKAAGLISVAMTGRGGGKVKDVAQYCLRVPSDETARIQECHILIGHIVCDFVERELFGPNARAQL
jgi:D-sedoheptulose 7-phosphate isomerase